MKRILLGVMAAGLFFATAANAATLVANTDSPTYLPGATVTITLTGTTVPYAPTGVEPTDLAQSIDVRILGAGFIYTEVMTEQGEGGTCIPASGCLAGAAYSVGGTQGNMTEAGNYQVFNQIVGLAPGALTNNMNNSVPPFLTGESSLNAVFTTIAGAPGDYDIDMSIVGVGFFGITGPQTLGGYTVIPEPTTAALMGLGLIGLAMAGRRT